MEENAINIKIILFFDIETVTFNQYFFNIYYSIFNKFEW